MRKMSEVKCVWGLRLAVAALTVAGVFGTVWAQSGAKQDKLQVKWLVEEKADIKTIQNLVDAAALGLTYKGSDTILDVGVNPGNLGIVRVATNSSAWDVTMTTKYGGKLVYMEASSPTQGGGGSCNNGQGDPWNPGTCLSGGTWQPAMTPGDMHSLTVLNANGDIDTVKLEIGIGVADSGAYLSTSATAKYYALGAPDTYNNFGATNIDATTLTSSGIYDPVTGTQKSASGAGAAQPISFAEKIGAKGSGWTIPNTINSWIKGTSLSNLSTTKLFGQPTNETAYFFVNVCLVNKTLATDPMRLKGNKGGTYEEEFTFNLVADF